ncbi:MAG: ParB N-terminal domain-containing protein [Thermoplasmatales archaeon]|nr:ParB N-terminal domain-containing protein [Thermoplasmatales archaeon]
MDTEESKLQSFGASTSFGVLTGDNMVRNFEKVEPLSIKKIIPNREQKLSFSEDNIKKIAENLKANGQVDPIIVRPFEDHNDKFEICKGQGIYEALVYLKKPTAQVIIKNYTSDQGCEIALASLFRHVKLTSIEREDHVYTRYKNGNYKSYRDLSKVIPLTPERIGYLIYAKEQRIKLGPNGPLVSTDTIIACRKLKIPEQRKFCIRVISGDIHGRAVHKEAKFIKSRSEDERKVLLDGTKSYKDAKYVIEKRFPLTVELLDKAKGKLKEKITLQKAVQEERIVFTPEVFQKHLDFIRELDPSYIDNIEGETERKQADSDETNAYVLHTRYMLKRGKIDENLFNTILKWFKLDPKIVEHLKEDGHNYAFESEYQTPIEQDLTEKRRKVDKTRGDPLKVLS